MHVAARFAAFLGMLSLASCAAEGAPEDGVDADGCVDEDTCASESDLVTAPPFVVGEVVPTRFPVILHHGFNASSSNGWSFHGVKEALERDGHRVVVTEVEPFAGVPQRAATLATIIDRAIGEHCARRPSAGCLTSTKVNLVAHSLGGLDARYVVASLGYGPKVASVTTVSSPHRGTALGDVALRFVPDGGTLPRVLDAAASLFGRTFTERDLAEGSDLRAAFESLAAKNADAFARENPDAPGVLYQSWAGVSRAVGGPRFAAERAEVSRACEGKVFGPLERADFMAPSLVPLAVVTGLFDRGPQDGMVTVASAKWGEFRGCFAADHLDEVGQPRHEGPNRWTRFDHRVFYRRLASELGARGL